LDPSSGCDKDERAVRGGATDIHIGHGRRGYGQIGHGRRGYGQIGHGMRSTRLAAVPWERRGYGQVAILWEEKYCTCVWGIILILSCVFVGSRQCQWVSNDYKSEASARPPTSMCPTAL
jgi:hypothetical protein